MTFIDFPAGDGAVEGAFGFRTFGKAADVIERLPSGAAGRLRNLRQIRDDAAAIMAAANDAKRDLLEDKLQKESALRRLRAHGYGAPEDHPERLRLEAEVVKRSEQIARQNQITEERVLRWQDASALCESVESYLRSLPSTATITDRNSKLPSVKEGANISGLVEAVCHRLRMLQADLKEVQAAPRSSAETKKALAQQVAELAQRGRPDLLRCLEHADPFQFPTIALRASVMGGKGLVSVQGVPDIAVLAWLFGDLLISRLNEEIDALADGDESALTDAQRTERERTISDDIVALEFEEEALIQIAAERGVTISRRSDASPTAVLGIMIGA